MKNKLRGAGVRERGQALILVIFAIISLVAMVGLAIDGGRIFSERRHVQNVTDNSAIAGAFAKCRGESVNNTVLSLAAINGYDNDGVTNTVTVNSPPTAGPYSGNTDYIEVIISSEIPPTFIQVVYSGELRADARAVSYCKMATGAAFNRAVTSLSNNCNNAIDISGGENIIIGGFHSNNDVKVSGSSNYCEGDCSYVSTIDGASDKIIYNPPAGNPQQVAYSTNPAAFDIEDFAPGGSIAAQVQAMGKYYSCNCKIDMGWLTNNGLWDDVTKTIAEGIYYTTGDISLSASEINGTVSLVSRETISFSGSNHTLLPYYEGLLAFTDKERTDGSKCSSSVISLSGSDQSWKGLIYAPNGNITVSGSSNNSIDGILAGWAVSVSGSSTTLKYNPAFDPPSLPSIELSE